MLYIIYPKVLFIYATGNAQQTDCSGDSSAASGTANDLSTKVAFLLFSLGPNASSSTSGTGTDEAENLDNDRVFVSHDPTISPNEFDDLLTWVPITILINRMVDAQRLP